VSHGYLKLRSLAKAATSQQLKREILFAMKFGVCAGFDKAQALKEAGFDFIELFVQGHLVPEKGDDEFLPLMEKISACELPCVAANGFIPGHLKITGPDVSERKLTRYVENACGRALRSGIDKIVFGSGGARQIPEGFSRVEAHRQLVEFGKMAAHVAAACGIVIVVEPLNKAECNVLTSVGESAEYVREVDSRSFRLLVDAYHFLKDDNDFDALQNAGHLLSHAHIATVKTRKAPGIEDCDFSKFFHVLKKTGYSETISVEGGWNDMAKEAPAALKAIKDAIKSA